MVPLKRGLIKKMKALYNIKCPVIGQLKYFYIFDLASLEARAEILTKVMLFFSRFETPKCLFEIIFRLLITKEDKSKSS